MDGWHALLRILARFRYPVSLPEDIAEDLGIQVSNLLSFKKFLHTLCHLAPKNVKLHKYMRRTTAEALFKAAVKKESFQNASLFSYYFKKDGWLALRLNFDEQSRLRRLYIEHPLLPKQSVEIPLT